jgi:hypothetical protein
LAQGLFAAIGCRRTALSGVVTIPLPRWYVAAATRVMNENGQTIADRIRMGFLKNITFIGLPIRFYRRKIIPVN